MFKPQDHKGETALVMGAGKSGRACAALLASRGFTVVLADDKKAEDLGPLRLPRGVRLAAGGTAAEKLSAGFAVKSPGMTGAHPLLKALRKKKVPVFSEVETALAFSRAERLLAVTGTNGKTTTTVLLGGIMKKALRRSGRALVCGNVGLPASSAAPRARSGDAVVMEVSSYQLEDSASFRPSSACILNITPDHLEHHGGMRGYIAAKSRIFASQGPDDSCVFNYEDPACRRLAAACPSRALFFSSARSGGKLDAWTAGGRLFFRHAGKIFQVKPPPLPGVHNLENAMCAGLMALSSGASARDLAAAFASFRGVEHRIESSGSLKGISFINDSKATNVESTAVALKAMGAGRRIWLILGGRGKGCSYQPLATLVRRSVKGILTIGEDAPRIESDLAGSAPVITSLTMQNACREILQLGSPGDIALFSPACASFDQFRDFEDRGRKFKAFVKALGRRGGRR